MSCGAGRFNSYLRGRERLYERIERRREMLDRHAQGAAETFGHKEILDDIAELNLVVATMLDVLIAKGVLSPDDLRTRAADIDILDGVADGMLHGHVEPGGGIIPDAPPQRTDLDDLAAAATDAEQRRADRLR